MAENNDQNTNAESFSQKFKTFLCIVLGHLLFTVPILVCFAYTFIPPLSHLPAPQPSQYSFFYWFLYILPTIYPPAHFIILYGLLWDLESDLMELVGNLTFSWKLSFLVSGVINIWNLGRLWRCLRFYMWENMGYFDPFDFGRATGWVALFCVTCILFLGAAFLALQMLEGIRTYTMKIDGDLANWALRFFVWMSIIWVSGAMWFLLLTVALMSILLVEWLRLRHRGNGRAALLEGDSKV